MLSTENMYQAPMTLQFLMQGAQVRDVLNHIQKKNKSMGTNIFLHAKQGMY